jgi:glycerophosphoryl diester phosphodiesterase
MKIVPWTVNTVAEIQRLVDMGIDGVISDYPDLFTQVKIK